MTTETPTRSKSGWCATANHDGCRKREAVALRCGCICHNHAEGER